MTMSTEKTLKTMARDIDMLKFGLGENLQYLNKVMAGGVDVEALNGIIQMLKNNRDTFESFINDMDKQIWFFEATKGEMEEEEEEEEVSA